MYTICFNGESSSTYFESYSVTHLHPLVIVGCAHYNSALHPSTLRLTWPFGLGMSTTVSVYPSSQTVYSPQPKFLKSSLLSLLLSMIHPLYVLCSVFDSRVTKTLSAELDQTTPVCVIPTFTLEELHKVLAGPCIKILDRYDFESVLLFLLMELRTALGSTWLNILHEL